MAKVSVGLRGWRFEESAIFDEDGEFRPLDEMPEDDRERIVRLVSLVERPCDACYLVHGEEEIERCRQATVVYGEPLDEVVLCDDHETDFVYWYHEAGGRAYRGEPELRDAFHAWFDDGGRAPEGYGGVDHVETDPEGLPDPPDAATLQARLEEGVEREKVDLREAAAELLADGEDEGGTSHDGERVSREQVDAADLDLDAEYPGGG
ncbi:MAG: hypothetical protein ABEJ61_06450 [Haloferacaceae archaeon]